MTTQPPQRPGQLTALSRRLSYVLRHDPASVGVRLDAAGWVGVETLLAAFATHQVPIDSETLDRLVDAPGKRRFSYDATRVRVRAAQGHSLPVELGLTPEPPPAVLFHGTTQAALPSILRDGLDRQSRQAVHLSASPREAEVVAARRSGSTVVLEVAAVAMAEAGWEFVQADNGVWLVQAVPPQFLRVLEGQAG